MNKVFSVWKPANITSYDIIRKIKTFNNSYRIGHCGTLDPFAEGVVVICMGESTKKSHIYMNQEKQYIAKIIFGKETDTLDLTGAVIKTCDTPKFDSSTFTEILQNFKGEINQVPPYYSAKKINNIKMYDFARNDIFIKLKPVKVFVNNIKLINLSQNGALIEINCNKGTYIRSLARDIAYKLGTYGYLESLERISVGEFNKQNSIKFKDLSSCKFIN